MYILLSSYVKTFKAFSYLEDDINISGPGFSKHRSFNELVKRSTR